MKKEKKTVFGLVTTEKKAPEIVPVDPPKSQMIELRKLILNTRGDEVVKKLLDIALDDEHPGQTAALKMCMDRLLPMAEFEKLGSGGRPTVTINISGINDNVTIEGEEA
jgi:hypothetical protein